MRKSGQWQYLNRHNEFQRSWGKVACIIGSHKYKISTEDDSKKIYSYCIRCGKTLRKNKRLAEQA